MAPRRLGLTAVAARRYTTAPPPPPPPLPSSPPPSATTSFYKTFSRPVAKTALLAVFTYQLIYWAWAKLESDEERAGPDAVIAELEARVAALAAAKAAQQPAAQGAGKPR